MTRTTTVVGCFLFLFFFWSPVPAQADDPESIEDLAAIERLAMKTAERVIPATVGLRLARGSGSGVIVSEDGYILTAAHVVGASDVPVRIVLHDGTVRSGRTLGINLGADYALVKMKDGKDLPFVSFGDSSKTSVGDWLVATGHPFGARKGRPPVLRIGRLIANHGSVIQTDCPLISGDSGGPLFSLSGRFIGIHSYIGKGSSANFHIPANLPWEKMDRLMAGEKIGSGRSLFDNRGSGAFLGVQTETLSDEEAKSLSLDGGVRIVRVLPGTAAEEAGLQEGDVILEVGGRRIANTAGLGRAIRRHEPGDRISVRYFRPGDGVRRRTIELGER